MKDENAEAKGSGACELDDETEKLLRDIYMAYAMPYGVYSEVDRRVKGGGKKGMAMPGADVVDAMDEIGWQHLCSDCHLDDNTSSMPPAGPVWATVAKGESLDFAGFIQVLKTVARERYGAEDAMARLVYCKVCSKRR